MAPLFKRYGSKENQVSSERKPIGEVVYVGGAGYQLFSRTFKGKVKRSARVGTPYTKTHDQGTPNERTTTEIFSEMTEESPYDFIEAAKVAAEELAALRRQSFRCEHQAAKPEAKANLELVAGANETKVA